MDSGWQLLPIYIPLAVGKNAIVATFVYYGKTQLDIPC